MVTALPHRAVTLLSEQAFPLDGWPLRDGYAYLRVELDDGTTDPLTLIWLTGMGSGTCTVMLVDTEGELRATGNVTRCRLHAHVVLQRDGVTMECICWSWKDPALTAATWARRDAWLLCAAPDTDQ